MKKTLAVLLSSCLILTLCACGAQGENGDADGDASPAVSVTVQSLSQDCKSDDTAGVVLLHYSDELPTVTIKNGETAQNAINSALQKIVSDFTEGSGDGTDGLDAYLAAAKADYKESSDRFLSGGCNTMERHVSVSRGDEGVLSFVYNGYIGLGGAHGTPFITGASFDNVTGAKLSINDLSNDPKTLISYCTSYITDLTHGKDYASTGFVDGYEKTLATIVSSGVWYFSHEGLVFVANVYDIAPYAAGSFRFTVPYNKIESLLKPAYLLPSNRTGDPGSLSISGSDASANPNTVGSETLSKNGRSFTLTAKGNIFDVTLSSVTYEDYDGSFTDSGTHLYFSNLADGQTIGVQAEIPEVIPNLQISWRNADGSAENRLITESGKDGSLLLMDYKPRGRMTGTEITNSLPCSADLDGDSANETIEFAKKQVPDESDMQYAVRVTDGGNTAEYQTQIVSDVHLWLADIDYDGKQELLISGNVMSDDYVIWCLKYEGGKLVTVPFSGTDGEKQSETADCWIESIGKDGIILGSAQYVLGTYGGLREFEYSGGSLHPVEGSVWSFSKNGTWLTTVADVPATYDDGQKTAIPAGSSILLTSTDGASWVRFADKNGASGSISIEKRDGYWGWYIGDNTEETYFESLPYAG